MFLLLPCVLFRLQMYWMVSFDPSGGRWWFFLLVIFCLNLTVSVFFRTIAFFAANADVASNMAQPTTIMFQLFAGFLITFDKIPSEHIHTHRAGRGSWRRLEPIPMPSSCFI